MVIYSVWYTHSIGIGLFLVVVQWDMRLLGGGGTHADPDQRQGGVGFMFDLVFHLHIGVHISDIDIDIQLYTVIHANNSLHMS